MLLNVAQMLHCNTIAPLAIKFIFASLLFYLIRTRQLQFKHVDFDLMSDVLLIGCTNDMTIESDIWMQLI